ncbi:putative ubiquitin fusion degradation protein C12B10.01c [Glarea lozoyensis 74030]|uniref:HECT-type E3 ubiquitin transferase n=1 Tax=Glarea lozoyensis (strain ATCC 74030 / MF5533) TaxID=1104152 RepID=H0EKT6_GLAL7|nr:putative ubiquitin fusion degradation protein C12B10.01c [Glarea lozoyensis 74030]
MSSRITRASTRRAASSSEASGSSGSSLGSAATPASARSQTSSRKRKVPPREPSPAPELEAAKVVSPRRTKRQKLSESDPPLPPPAVSAAAPSRRKGTKGKTPAVMSSPGDSAGPSNDPPVTSSSKRKSARNKKNAANLMEALPASTANVVYGGAVPILCQKLLEIHFIDLAEQALSTLEKISVEYPASIVREGGLTACLTYLDFFATSTQRTAVTTAANCCRNIPEDSFSVIRDVMPILLNVLSSSDQKVVEQGSLCVSRVVESFRYHPNKLEELVSTDLLKAILRLLLPGTTNLIGPNIHTQFLRVLAFTAKASATLSAELFKMNVVETLYQILTGVSPPDTSEDMASKIDSVVIMQALIHRPREQVIETLNVICELLPGLPRELEGSFGEIFDPDSNPALPNGTSSSSRKKSTNEKRIELLEGCKQEVKRFAIILFPTLTDAFSSTVNLSVRQKVLTAQLKMLTNLDKDILVDALRSVPYASFLAAILSQQDHPSLVNYALQAAELLLTRLDDIYRYQFYREGVIAEIAKLVTTESNEKSVEPATPTLEIVETNTAEKKVSEKPAVAGNGDDEDDEDDSSDDDNDDNENENENDDIQEDASQSPVSSRGSTMSLDGPSRQVTSDATTMQQLIAERAKRFIEVHETDKNSKSMKKKATKILTSLQGLASEIEAHYLHQGPGNGQDLFTTLASYFDGDVLESVTSAELLNSEVVRVLLDIFNNPDERLSNDARSAFLEVFMGRNISKKSKSANTESVATPFSSLIHKLQDLLSRSEHFEVVTVHQNTFDGNRSSAASMLAKQIRLKLVADDESEIPRPYRNIMVSIHAIATFKALDDYLRPRISMSERPRDSRREGLSGALAALAAAATPAAPTPSASRAARKAKSKTAPAATPASDEQSAINTPQEKPVSRRSSRRNQAQTEPPAPPPPPQEEDSLARALECADERQLTDDEDMEESAALDAIVDEMEDEMEDATPPDPTAVSLEVAAGGKVTARKEDGTRVATPSQMPGSNPRTASAFAAAAAAAALSTPSASRPMSYAAAIQSVPQDWHIEFSLDDKVLSNETTIYRAVHNPAGPVDEHTSRSVWSAVHPIKFKRVAGPPPPEPSSVTQAAEASELTASGIPASLDKHPATSDRHRDERPFLGRLQRQKVRISRSKILESALKVMELYGASQSILEVEYFEEVGTGLGPTLEFYSTVSKEFSKKKLKLWRETDTNENDEYAFGLSGLFPAPMSEDQALNENGKRILHLFKMLGKFTARSMIDSRIIDVSFNPTFFRIGDGSNPVNPSLGAVKTVDAQLAKSLKLIKKFAVAKKAIDENPKLSPAQKVDEAERLQIDKVSIDDLGLDFTLPGYSTIELLPNGANIAVTIENVELYLDKVIDMTLGSGVQRQVDAFRAGFTQVFPFSALSAFTPDELVMLFGRIEEDWSLETLMDSIKADHGFNMDSKSVKNLLQTMSELSLPERRDFLQFTTGSPKLPIGESSLVLAIISDYDICDTVQLEAARQTLDALKADAPSEEATGFDASGAGRIDNLNNGFETQADDESAGDRCWKSQTDDTSVSQEMALPDLEETDVETNSTPSTQDESPERSYTSALDSLGDNEKEAALSGIFPILTSFDIRWTLKKHKGDTNLAIDELMTQSFLEENGSRHKGVDAFYEDGAPSKPRKGKKKKRREVEEGGLSNSDSIPSQQSKWATAKHDIDLISLNTDVPSLPSPKTAGTHAGSIDLAASHMAARNNNFEKAAAYYRKGKSDHLMGGAAAYYALEGRNYNALAKASSSAAADALVAAQSSRTELDLHGVNVKDALRISRERVTNWWHELGEARIMGGIGGGYRIVTGIGRHSEGGRLKLGPAVGKMLIREGWKVEVGSGVLVVKGIHRQPAVIVGLQTGAQLTNNIPLLM